MGLTTKELQSRITKQECPHYYEVSLPNKQMRHCGTMIDVECMLSMYPGALYNKVMLPHPPETVDVSHVSLKDKELPPQRILSQSDLKPLEL